MVIEKDTFESAEQKKKIGFDTRPEKKNIKAIEDEKRALHRAFLFNRYIGLEKKMPCSLC